MILTVTLNPALDLTYHVDALTPGATHRVSRVDERLGGKGVNVASVLAQLGEPTLMTGLLADTAIPAALPATALGTPLAGTPATGLDAPSPSDAAHAAATPITGVTAPPPASFNPISGATRRTVVVTDGRDATGFWEPGPTVHPHEWAAFLDHFERLLPEARVVTLSGSLPGGLKPGAYAELIAIARDAGAKTILDTSGTALTRGLAAAPDIVKPNAAERADLGPAPDATVVVASHGPDGLTALHWRARPPRHIDGNPTGAGDACVAALARGLLHGTPWPEMLRDAVALSAAAVASPVAGHVDLDLYRELLPQITIEES